MTTVDLDLTAMAVGGESIGRENTGRVVFVTGGAPGDRVRVRLSDQKARFARGEVVEVLEPSTDRVEAPCPHVASGCGGCDWQHLSLDAQRRLRMGQVQEALSRTGGIADPPVELGPALPAAGMRTTVRGVADADGRFAFRRRRSNEPVPVDSCLISHRLVEEVISAGRFPVGAEVTIRVGARTGERSVVLSGDPTDAVVPADVLVVGVDALRSGHRSWIHEEIAGRRWRVSAGSFLQASPEGAEALVAAVRSAVETHAPNAERLVDLCAGIGLFAGTVGAGMATIAVERERSAVADARHNLADLDTRVLPVSMEAWRPSRCDVVIADPARAGLGAIGVDRVAATGAGLCVLVSCEVGSLGRDARLLSEAGYRHGGSMTLDLFAHTGRVEVVSTFHRI